MKKNCWEFKNCGRQQGGHLIDHLGVCPAAKAERLDGVHGGKNAGRACWVIAGTYCDGSMQGSFAMKYKNCEKCDFFRLVRNEEAASFVTSGTLLNKLRHIV